MAEELTPVQAEDTPAKAKKKGGLMRKLMVLLVVSLGAGGAGAWWMLNSAADAVAAEEPAEPPMEERGLVTFEPFLVNLADSGGNRFLKATVQLVLESSESAAHVQESAVLLMHVRSAILELLSEQHAAELVTPEGKRQLKDALKASAEAALSPEQVIDVLFSEFVVQF